MDNRLAIGAVVAAVSLLAVWPAYAQDDEYWQVPRAQAECLLKHAAEYAEAGLSPTVIYLLDCPGNDPAVAFAQMQSNSILPKGTNGQAAFDMILVYTPAELECLVSVEIALDAEPVQLPKRPRC